MRCRTFCAILALALVILPSGIASTAWAMQYKVLYKFQGGLDGALPTANVTFDTAGNLYGTTAFGGAYGYGTAFKMTLNPDGTWSENTIFSFDWGVGGADPHAGLSLDADGSLYGTTVNAGGNFTWGVAFKIMPHPDGQWTENVIYRFSTDKGTDPYSTPVFDAAGNLYGTTLLSGGFDCWGSGCGTVYKLTPRSDGTWTASVLHAFHNDGSDGYQTQAGLILDAYGNLYGTTPWGGQYDGGTVFRLTPGPDGSWDYETLYSFGGGDGGRSPSAGLLLDGAGNLYSTTVYGGGSDLGTVFELSADPDGTWRETTLHAFDGTDGANPSGGLIFDAAGRLYGTTTYGGEYDSGTVFKLAPRQDGGWKFARLHLFKNGQHPESALVTDPAGNLYGTTTGGGPYDTGIVYEITP